ncbi:hypothetical protein D9Q98_007750 [Chlorella vulgaris]|uniref:5'-nucleotidase n=1 Tax=Chlorella vulgaris TaxID=3077 RepID=A0A9D4YTL9_CHLVU|nr:hypothetical protein D9Q98_007750 [Chlorella vulgaris]
MSPARSLTILHLNDTYDIEARSKEPVGGAARMAAKIKSFGPTALVLHSGDVFNPCLLSTITQGTQMVEVLNCCNVRAACVGNHDFDYGVPNFELRAAECNFPWLMANVLDVDSGSPLGGAIPTALFKWQGVQVGIVGLAEQEWLTTLASVEADDIRFLDFVQEGTRLAQELREQGAEVVLALTHMRLPNDLQLAGAVPGIDVVLGGHDHDYFLIRSQPHGTPVVKSGTDFQDLTEIQITLSEYSTAAAAGTAAGAAEGEPQAQALPGAHRAELPGLVGTLVGSSSSGATSPCPPASPQLEAAVAASGGAGGAPAAAAYQCEASASLASSLSTCRAAGGAAGGPFVTVKCVRHTITSDIPEDPEVAAIVQRYRKVMGERMDVVVGTTAVDLDGRFATVRTAESNLGNFIADVWREACHADVALCNGGTFRSDSMHPAGDLTHRDLVTILPMLDETVVIQVSGKQLVAALENGVSQWPKHEGRFPQVSGLRFAFDASKPAGHRIVSGSVTVGGNPLQADQVYSLATKKYLAEGHDGYEALKGAPLLCDADCTPLLPTVLMNHFLLIRTLNHLAEVTGRLPVWRRAADRLLQSSKLHHSRSQERLQQAGVSHTVRKHPVTGRWEAAPTLDGRIQMLGLADASNDSEVASGH